MTYLSNLEWMRTLQAFSDQEQKVLLALSHGRFKWRTRPKISKASGLSKDEIDRLLSNLIEAGLVRPSFSRTKKVIFGLRERVGKG